jgi:branched-chain amino acid transport system substrate-binding protein
MRVCRLAATLLLVTATGASLAACSSGGGTSSSGTSSSASTSSTGDIVIGSIGAYSGALASSEGGVPKVTAAWASTVNATGGLGGHKVQVINEDIGTTTGADLTAAQELIERDHVVAIFDFDTQDATWLPYAQSKGVPVIALTSAGLETSPDAFPITEAEKTLGYSLPSLAKTVGPKFGIVYCAEVASCGQLASIFAGAAEAQGMQVPVNVKVSSSEPDYTAVCQDLKSAGVDSYVVVTGGAVVVKIADQCRQEGVRASLVQDGGQAQNAWKTDPAFNGMHVTASLAPFFLDNTPAHKAYRDALSTYAANVANSSQDNQYSEAAWLDGKLIEAALTKATSAPVTADTVKQGLYSLKGETLGGMIQPVTYTPGKPTLLGCYFSWTAQNGAFTAPNGDKYECVPDSVLSGS